MNILALDLGKHNTVFCDYNSTNSEHEFGKVRTTPQEVHDLIVEREPPMKNSKSPMKNSKSSNKISFPSFFCFEGILRFAAGSTGIVALILIFEQPIFRRSELCSVISEGINDLIRFAGNRINVANHL